MPRITTENEYVLHVNLRAGDDVRRFCEVHVQEKNDVYVFQPRKGGSTKVSYHASGERHVKRGNGPSLYTLRLDPPEWIESEESCWEQSFENFSTLLSYRDESADDIFAIDLTAFSDDTITLAQVSIGRFFDTPSWIDDGVRLTTLHQQVFPVTKLGTDLSICVRVIQLKQTDSNPLAPVS